MPTSTNNVLIPNTVSNYPTLSAAGACNNITMQSGASLLGNQYLTVSGTAMVDRAIPGASQAWHFLSSPVAMQAISPAFTADPATSYDFFAWYEPTGEWVNFKNTTVAPTWGTANGSTNFTTGKGYLVEYTGTGLTKQFTGSLNAGSISSALTYSGAGVYKANNLLGNPYPSAIDWKASSGWNRANLVSSGGGYVMSIWNDALSTGNYGTFNSAGSSGSGTNGVTQYIPAGQGFMVKATAAGTLGMTDAIRVHNTQAYLKSTDAIANILRVKVAGDANTYSDEIMVEFGHPTDDGARFLLHFGGAFSIGENAKEQPITVYASGNTVYIATSAGVRLKGRVIVYNMIGQTVKELPFSENPLTSFNISGATGYYLVMVVTDNHVYSAKVFID